MTAINKRHIVMRYRLLERGYYNALEAMEFANGYHRGFRKDAVTPEFDHQIAIASYLRTLLPSVQFPEETFCTVFLHDVREDYGVGHEEIESRFGARVANSVKLLTKKFRGETVDPTLLFERMAEDEIASIVKGADRIHNLQSMVGVFSAEKQRSYVTEAQDLFLPMLKKARRNFPRQEEVYENIKLMLKSQIALIEAGLASQVMADGQAA